jgi:hypothetical protein
MGSIGCFPGNGNGEFATEISDDGSSVKSLPAKFLSREPAKSDFVGNTP